MKIKIKSNNNKIKITKPKRNLRATDDKKGKNPPPKKP